MNQPSGEREAASPTRSSLSPTVIWLGVVSFLTDASGEMIYALLPRFLTVTLHAERSFVGIVEGVAEATASLFKLVSGRIADAVPRKKPLVVGGYTLSSLARPLVALATAPWMVLAVRFVDRVGKGVRGSPRDALVAEVTPRAQRGAAYGYHRAMDNAGAVLGPLVGWALLTRLGLDMRSVFAWAAVPGGLAVAALVFGVRERRRDAAPPDAATQQPGAISVAMGDAATQHAASDRALVRYLFALGVFTLANSSDAFLILRAQEVGVETSRVLLVWTLHNFVKAALSHRLGALSDRLGRRRLIAGGWILYALTYLGFARADAGWQMWLLFAVYGVYYALVEGAERALVADLAGAARRGRAFGWFHATTGLLALPASALFGGVYQRFGAVVAFEVAAGLALAAVALLGLVRAPRDTE